MRLKVQNLECNLYINSHSSRIDPSGAQRYPDMRKIQRDEHAASRQILERAQQEQANKEEIEPTLQFEEEGLKR